MTPPSLARDVQTHLVPRSVASATGVDGAHRLLRDGSATLTGGSSLVLDFGEEVVGPVSLVARAAGPAVLRAFYGEDLVEAMVTADPFPEPNWYRMPTDRFELAAGAHRLRSTGRRAFRYLHLRVEGAAVELDGVHVALEHHPVERIGRFRCSDELLNRAWEISERTTRLCMQRYYEDGVKRDGLLWIADYRVQYLCNATLFGDVELARRSLRMIAATQHADGSLPACAVNGGAMHDPERGIDYMPGMSVRDSFVAKWVLHNFTSDFVSGVREYHLYTGDDALLLELWPTAKRAVGRLRALDVESLKPGGEFITDLQPDFPSWWGSRAAMEMHVCWALRDGAALADLAEEPAFAAACRAEADRRGEAARGRYLSARDGAFRVEADPVSGPGWQVNAIAALAGVLGAEEAPGVLVGLTGRPDVRRAVAGFMEYWVLAAMLEAGLTNAALAEMRRYWGRMLEYGATTCWDAVDFRFDGIERPTTHAMSHCHGWSAGPAHLLPTYVLGVRPAAPGMSRLTIRPQLDGLAWAEGVVPTPHGPVRVRWEASPSLAGSIELPAGVAADVHLPGGEVRTLGPGAHTLSTTKAATPAPLAAAAR